MTLSEHHDLRGGRPVWDAERYPIPPADPLPQHCEIAIVGAGIMGATLGERLSAAGPADLDQAARVAGVTPAALSALHFALVRQAA